MEKCIHYQLIQQSPTLDLAQGGFRVRRSAMDQAANLQQLCHYFTKSNRQGPVLAFLDIKSAYDTVDRSIIWRQLRQTASPKLARLVQHLFDDVSITVMQQNYQSRPFSPVTGVLQGSILSPHLYSLYIDSLPRLLRPPTATPNLTTISDLLQAFNCLLYADDVALIGTPTTIQALLDHCERHSYQLGYRWSPTKCVILDSNNDTTYKLYNTTIPKAPSFKYLGIPFDRGGK